MFLQLNNFSTLKSKLLRPVRIGGWTSSRPGEWRPPPPSPRPRPPPRWWSSPTKLSAVSNAPPTAAWWLNKIYGIFTVCTTANVWKYKKVQIISPVDKRWSAMLILSIILGIRNSALSRLRAFWWAHLAKIGWEGARKHFIRPGCEQAVLHPGWSPIIPC